ncbi:MAG: hypothetical protein ABSB18_07865 [Candidatus Omnitrophota bacterium]
MSYSADIREDLPVYRRQNLLVWQAGGENLPLRKGFSIGQDKG